MAETDNKHPKGYKSVIRIIEYHGPVDWLEKTLSASRIPIQGAFKPSADTEVFIKSGIVAWMPDNVTQEQVDNSEIMMDGSQVTDDVNVKGIEDNSSKRSTVVFKRPGEN